MSPPTASTTSLLEHMPCKQSCEWTQRSTWRRLSGRNGTKRVMRFCWMMLEWKKPPGERHFSFLYPTAMELTAVQPAQLYTGKLACLINCTKTSNCFICVCPSFGSLICNAVKVVKWWNLKKALTCVAVVHSSGKGFLQVLQLDLLSVPSSLTVLQRYFFNHLLSCGAAGITHITSEVLTGQLLAVQ